MVQLVVRDPGPTLGVPSSVALSFSKALLLLAIATSPAPGSRYQPNSRWAVLKYATVSDPRVRSRTGRFVVNPGIDDLDPHQKAVLADDVGVALALGVLDRFFGIIGLADVYQLVASGHIRLRNRGRHRKMPDFLIETSIPVSGSKTILLECKGSVRPTAYASQLDTACIKQLANVASVRGCSAQIPRIAAAACLSPGAPAELHVSDPPEELDTPEQLSRLLRANWLALEYELFGDVRSANAVWSHNGLRGWAGDQPGIVGTTSLEWTASMRQTLRRSNKRIPDSNAAQGPSTFPGRDVDVAVAIQASATATAIREHQAWHEMNRRQQGPDDWGSVSDAPGQPDPDRSIREDSRTFSGVRIRQTIELSASQ